MMTRRLSKTKSESTLDSKSCVTRSSTKVESKLRESAAQRESAELRKNENNSEDLKAKSRSRGIRWRPQSAQEHLPSTSQQAIYKSSPATRPKTITIPDMNCDVDNIALNRTEVKRQQRNIQNGILANETITRLKYSFERVPSSESWYDAFLRQDECKERVFEYWGNTVYRKLPYEIGTLPPLAPDCCSLNKLTLRNVNAKPPETQSAETINPEGFLPAKTIEKTSNQDQLPPKVSCDIKNLQKIGSKTSTFKSPLIFSSSICTRARSRHSLTIKSNLSNAIKKQEIESSDKAIEGNDSQPSSSSAQTNIKSEHLHKVPVNDTKNKLIKSHQSTKEGVKDDFKYPKLPCLDYVNPIKLYKQIDDFLCTSFDEMDKSIFEVDVPVSTNGTNDLILIETPKDFVKIIASTPPGPLPFSNLVNLERQTALRSFGRSKKRQYNETDLPTLRRTLSRKN